MDGGWLILTLIMLAEGWEKLFGNAGYGRTLLDKYKQSNTTFVDTDNVPRHVANPCFKSMLELNDKIYEVEKKKKNVVLDLLQQIGVAVYNYAKLVTISGKVFT